MTVNPGDSGEGLFWSQLNPVSEHQMRSYYLSAIQLGESENQDLMTCDQNAGWKREWYQSFPANEMHEEKTATCVACWKIEAVAPIVASKCM